jgi:uncharacterized protein (TIRG00374 family)
MKILENIKKNTILILGVTVIVLYFLLKDNFNEIVHNLQQIRIEYIILAFLFFLAYVSLKGFVNYLIINDKEKIPVKEAITQNFISQFFNGITPFATGGEPMAVYMLMERKISFANATHYMVLSFIFYQISLVLFGFFAVGYNYTVGLFPEVKFLQNLVLIGFLINIFVVLILLLSYSNRFIKFIRGIVIKICKKLRINRTEEDIYQKFEDYHNGLVELKNRKPLIGIGLVLNMISLICLYSIPYWIIRGMGVENMSFINTIVSSAYVYLIGVFVPIPGASGGIEYGFTQFFGNFLTPSVVSAVIIVWRFMTYYMGILIGAILFNLRKKEE